MKLRVSIISLESEFQAGPSGISFTSTFFESKEVKNHTTTLVLVLVRTAVPRNAHTQTRASKGPEMPTSYFPRRGDAEGPVFARQQVGVMGSAWSHSDSRRVACCHKGLRSRLLCPFLDEDVRQYAGGSECRALGSLLLQRNACNPRTQQLSFLEASWTCVGAMLWFSCCEWI